MDNMGGFPEQTQSTDGESRVIQLTSNICDVGLTHIVCINV